MILFLLIALLLAAPLQAANIPNAHGCFTGDGIDGKAITTGYCAEDLATFCTEDVDCGTTCTTFQPDMVWVDQSDVSNQFGTVFTTSDMDADSSCRLSEGGTTSADCGANWIQSLTATGFTVGDDNLVNTNGEPYCWSAWKATADAFAVFKHTGTGDTTSIATSFAAKVVGMHKSSGGTASGLCWRTTDWKDPIGGGGTPTPTPDPNCLNANPVRGLDDNRITAISGSDFTIDTVFDSLGEDFFGFYFGGDQITVDAFAGDQADATTTEQAIALAAQPLFVWAQGYTSGAADNTYLCGGWKTTEDSSGYYFHTASAVDWDRAVKVLNPTPEVRVRNESNAGHPDCNRDSRTYRVWSSLIGPSPTPTPDPNRRGVARPYLLN